MRRARCPGEGQAGDLEYWHRAAGVRARARCLALVARASPARHVLTHPPSPATVVVRPAGVLVAVMVRLVWMVVVAVVVLVVVMVRPIWMVVVSVVVLVAVMVRPSMDGGSV